jgi:DMSO/TMAO reductase YedYZ molybdopterin-dependent catalytic subunit
MGRIMSRLLEMQTPVFAAEGVPFISPNTLRVKVDGLVAAPKTYTQQEIKALPVSRINARLTSVSGWSVRVNWDGIAWQDFMSDIAVTSQATHVTFTSYGGYATTVSLADLTNPRVLLAYGVEGEVLEPEYGGPLRIVIPNLWGYKSCKWLVHINFVNAMRGGYWEDQGYTRSGIIEKGKTFDVNTKIWRDIAGGEVTEF